MTNRFKRALLVSFLLALGSLGPACAGGYSSQDKLIEAINLYNEGIRWGRYDDILLYIPQTDQAAFMDNHKGWWGGNVSISGYEVLRTAYDKENNKALVQVRLSWYRRNELVVRTTTFEDRWEKDQNGDWKIQSERVVDGPLP